MPLVLIHAQAPWGPISFKTAGSMAELLARGERPAEIIDVGERDPADVVREALRMLPPPFDATGQIPATVEKARNSVVEAVSRVLATHGAETTPEPVSGKLESHGGPIASNGEAEPEFSEATCAQAREIPANAEMSGNERIQARVRRRAGAEVDAREIRAKLGMSQAEFAGAYGIPVATLRDWEQGRRLPDGAGRSLLLLIERFPVRARRALEEYGVAVEA